jgi:hypothetical protein
MYTFYCVSFTGAHDAEPEEKSKLGPPSQQNKEKMRKKEKETEKEREKERKRAKEKEVTR